MKIDIPTLSVVLLISNILLVITFFIQYRLNRSYQGIGCWLSGTVGITLATVFIALQEISPWLAPVNIILNNVCFFGGTLLIYCGILRFLGLRENRKLNIAIIILFTFIIVYFTIIQDNSMVRHIVLALGVALVSFITGRCLLVYKPASIVASANFTAVIFFIQSIFNFILIADLANLSRMNGLLNFMISQTAEYLVTLITTVLWTFGMILMINQRLVKDMGKSKEQFELIFNVNPDAMSITRLQDGYIVDINESFTELTGFTCSEISGKSIFDIKLWVNLEDRNKVIHLVKEHGFCRSFETIFRRGDGSLLYVSLSADICILNGQDHMISVFRDISELKRAETQKQEALKALYASEQLYRSILQASPDNITITDLQGNIRTVSPIALTMFEYKTEDEILGHPLTDFLIPSEVERAQKNVALMFTGIFTGPNEYTAVRADGSLIEIEVNAEFIRDADGSPASIVYIIRDITERKRLKEELQQQASTDDLTGVTNRRHFIKTANYEIARAIRFEHPMSIALVDIDNFKSINDTYGHAAGDETLIRLTKICRENIRDVDIFARLGGDEFVLLLPDTACNQAYQVVERIRRSLNSLSVNWEDQKISITISSGIAGLEHETDTLDILLARADQVLYQAKDAGKNHIMVNNCQ
ncbi:MAG: diguanylate cyclase [Anaerolineae bacterium]|nr:diguanylate cyclase [Anaerolineae bacterium]